MFRLVLTIAFFAAVFAMVTLYAHGQQLRQIQVMRDGVNEVEGLWGSSSVTVSPDGKNVYSASSGSIVVFRRNSESGTLVFVEAISEGADGVTGLAGSTFVTVSPDGEHVYAAGTASNAITAWKRNTETGALTFIEAQIDGIGDISGLENAFDVTLTPDGEHVYGVGERSNSVAVFSRNRDTGALTFVEAKFDGVDGVAGLLGPFGVTVSPEGTHLYATGGNSNSVAVFSRNRDTGVLTFVEAKFDGVDGVTDLNRPFGLAVSSEGAHLYSTGLASNSVAVFNRNRNTGTLTFVEAHNNRIDGVEGLRNAVDVHVSPERGLVYVAGGISNAIAIFSRDHATGALTFLEAHFQGLNGIIGGLDGVFSLALSPDERNVYSVGVFDNALGVFAAFEANPIDITRDGVIDSLDVQLAIRGALGIGNRFADVNGDGARDAVDVQLVINAALGV